MTTADNPMSTSEGDRKRCGSCALNEWRESGTHLPTFMRDFHDQKELFKTIDEQSVSHDRERMPDWIMAHCYTVDAFLWFMARHGYTLQKCRAQVEFDDIHETLSEAFSRRRSESAAVLREMFARPSPSTSSDEGGR